ncbi:helix-turn-helix transcriptional regulator [Streptomyces sp. NPDC037389]|uniref:helix-turn-helix domain-containing protein n=1 Tax=Streptomyces sp. NPDC037389 TaxID=3155369 RepID=UPI0033D5801E
MSPEGRHAFGARVAELRAQRGLTQKELAAEIGRTMSWLSQVERGVQPVNRLDVLRLLARSLGVEPHELRPDAPRAEEPGFVARSNDLDRVRLLLSGHPAPGALLASGPKKVEVPFPELRAGLEHVWSLAHGGMMAELSDSLSKLVPRLESLARTARGHERPQVYGMLARAYQAMAAAFVRQNEADAAWVAADRAIAAAEMSGRVLDIFAGSFRLAHACLRLKRYDQAEHVAQSAVNALARHLETGDTEETPGVLSLLGSLHLVLAQVHARCGNRSAARGEVGSARRAAERLGEDRNDFNLEFGPTNVEIQAVSVAVDLGDAGEALDIGARLDASGLSVERQARLALDIGRAHAQLRHLEEALQSFLDAEQLAPETIQSHVAARSAIRDLMRIEGRAASPELRALAQRADALS